MVRLLKNTKGLLLAAGVGARLKPLTNSTPKCLVHINDKPLLWYWLDILFGAGIDRILINTHHLSEQVIEFCATSPYRNDIDIVYEEELLGTAGTLRANKLYFDNTLLMAHADNFSIFDPCDFYLKHLKRPKYCRATMMTFDTDVPSSCGIVKTSHDGSLIEYYEKIKNPPGSRANAAVFILEKSCLDWLKELPNATDFCKDIIPHHIHEFFTYHNNTYHRDIGRIESLIQANKDYSKLQKFK